MEALAAIHCKITFSEWHYQLSTIINQGKWIRLDYRTYCGSDYVDDHSRGHFVCTGWRKPLRGLLTREMNHQLSRTTFMIIYIYIFISLHKCYLWACKQTIWHHNNKKDRFTNFFSFRKFWGWKWSRWKGLTLVQALGSRGDRFSYWLIPIEAIWFLIGWQYYCSW